RVRARALARPPAGAPRLPAPPPPPPPLPAHFQQPHLVRREPATGLVQQFAPRNDPAGARFGAGVLTLAGVAPFEPAVVAAAGPVVVRLVDDLVAGHARQQVQQLLGGVQLVLP